MAVELLKESDEPPACRDRAEGKRIAWQVNESLDSFAAILAIASGLAEHEGERRAIANKIIELATQAMVEIDVSSEDFGSGFTEA